MLRPQKGNMYPFVTHTWNTVKGKCSHDCLYCYMKRFKQNDLYLDNKEFKTDLGEGNFIFVGSSCDMWADDIPNEWISKTLGKCHTDRAYKNTYLFQSKNPEKFLKINPIWWPESFVLGTTIESNRWFSEMGKAPHPRKRAISMGKLSKKYRTMITIEPIMDFDYRHLISLIWEANPEWVNIGADSKGHNLPEPSSDKIHKLINGIKNSKIEIKVKSNLKRLLKTNASGCPKD